VAAPSSTGGATVDGSGGRSPGGGTVSMTYSAVSVALGVKSVRNARAFSVVVVAIEIGSTNAGDASVGSVWSSVKRIVAPTSALRLTVCGSL
jgi:hypothetical protein